MVIEEKAARESWSEWLVELHDRERRKRDRNKAELKSVTIEITATELEAKWDLAQKN
jgi:hypothetical protein